jgi:cysteine desulfurase
MQSVYLDNNATTFLHPEVAEQMASALRAGYGNPASQHATGRRARRVVEDAREEIAAMLGAAPQDQLIFTSGGTEANNLAIRGIAAPPRLSNDRLLAPASVGPNRPLARERQAADSWGKIAVSAIEHASVHDCCQVLAKAGQEVMVLQVNMHGQVTVDLLRERLADDVRLICVMLGNNETGVLQPVAQLAALAADHQIPFHTDAVQAVGKIPVDFRKLHVTSLSFCAHKFHGPRGIGGLLVRDRVAVEPLMQGGYQQGGLRPGTEPVELIVGLAAALRLWKQEAESRQARLTALRDRLEQTLCEAAPELVIHGRQVERLPQTSNISFPGVNRQALVMALDLAGIACSTGSACASGSSEPSPVLLAMGLPNAWVESALRFSWGVLNTASEVDLAAGCILRLYRDLRQRKSSENGSGSSRPTG